MLEAVIDAAAAAYDSSIVQFVLAALLVPLMVLLGTLLHEYSHALMARFFGCRVYSIQIISFFKGAYCEYEPPAETWKVRVIGVAPLLFGLLAALPWLVGLLPWSWTPLSVLAMGTWLIWTFSGGLADYSPADGRVGEKQERGTRVSRGRDDYFTQDEIERR